MMDSFVPTLAKGLISDGYNVMITMAVDPDSPPQFREAEVIAMGKTAIRVESGNTSLFKTVVSISGS